MARATNSGRRTQPGGLKTNVGVAALLVVYAIPVTWLILTSFKSDVDIVNRVASPIFEPTLDAYRSVANGELLQSMSNSLLIATAATAIIMAFSVPAAYVLATLKRGRGLAIWTLVALQTIPIASFVIPIYSVLHTWELLGTRFGVSLAISAMATPFTILLLRPFFLSVPSVIEEAAEIDGAGVARTFFQVVIPNVRNGLLTVAVLNFIHAWGEFTFSISLLNDQNLYPVSALLAQQIGLYGAEWNRLMALAVLSAVPMVIVFALVARNLSSGLALGHGK